MDARRKRQPNFLNTFQLGPTDGKPKLAQIKEIMHSVISGNYEIVCRPLFSNRNRLIRA